MSDDFTPTRAHLQTVRRVERLVARWRPALSWLSEWELDVIPKPSHDLGVRMSVNYFEFIMKATLWVHPEAIGVSDDALEQVLLHEFGHLLLVDLHNHFYSAMAAQGSHRDRANTEERICWRFAKSLQSAVVLGSAKVKKDS